MQLFIKIILFQKNVCALPCVAILVGLRLYLVQSLQSVSVTKKQKANQIGSQMMLFQKQLLLHSIIFTAAQIGFDFCFFQINENEEMFNNCSREIERWIFNSSFNQIVYTFFTNTQHTTIFLQLTVESNKSLH